MNGGRPSYDSRIVPAHGDSSASVYLMAEAPGRREAQLKLPLVGPQGGNLYRMLCASGIGWSERFAGAASFKWPIKAFPEEYADERAMEATFLRRDQFLRLRRRYVKCTNSFDQWPRSGPEEDDFVPPHRDDVCSDRNLSRIAGEIESESVLLICGASAWLALIGEPLSKPSDCEGSKLTPPELAKVNDRVNARFERGWYLGHPRRWSLRQDAIKRCLQAAAKHSGWDATQGKEAVS